MHVSYYDNRLLFVGVTWSGHKASYLYSLDRKDADFLLSILSDMEAVKKWVKSRAGDFQQLIDFRLEVYDSVIDFKNEESWDFFEIPEFEADVCY